MPGLTCVWDLHHRDDLAQRFSRLQRASELKPDFRVNVWHDPEGRVALGRADLAIFNGAPQPLKSRDGNYWICFQGEIFDCAQAIARLALRGIPLTGRDNPDLLLATYLADGLDGIASLNGSFFFTLWDAEHETLIVGSDRHGARPHMYSFHEGRFYLAPQIQAVLAGRGDRPAMDVAGVSEFLALEHPLADRTPIEGIKVFPGGTFLILNRAGVTWDSYWTPRYTGAVEESPRSPADWMEEASHLYQQAIRRQMTGSFCLPLSGGTDSRAILAFGGRTDFPVYTFGDEASEDVLLARQVAARLGMRHHFVPLTPDYLVRNAAETLALGEGMMSLFHAHNVDGIDEVGRIRPVTLYGLTSEFGRLDSCDNVLAEPVRSARHRLQLLARHAIAGRRPLSVFETPDALTERILHYSWSNLTPELAMQVLEPEFAAAMIEAVTRGVSEQMAGITGPTIEDRTVTFNLLNRQRRFTQWGVKVAGTAHEVRKPFDDYDLVDFHLRTPAATRRKMLTQVICHLDPVLASIPRTGSGTALNAGFARRGTAYARKLVKKALHPARTQSFADPQVLLRTQARSFYEDILLDPSTLDNGYFKPDGLRRLVVQHMAGEVDAAAPLLSLATFELWRRMFLAGHWDRRKAA